MSRCTNSPEFDYGKPDGTNVKPSRLNGPVSLTLILMTYTPFSIIIHNYNNYINKDYDYRH